MRAKFDICVFSKYVAVTLFFLHIERVFWTDASITRLNIFPNLSNLYRDMRLCVRARAVYCTFSIKSNSKREFGKREKKERGYDVRARTTSSFNALLMPACLPLKFWKTSSGVRGLNSLIGLLVQV